MTLHRQVLVQVDERPAVEVDEGPAPILAALWEQGYETTASCEHLPETPAAFIAFTDRDGANRFAAMIRGHVAPVTVDEPTAEEKAKADPEDPSINGAFVDQTFCRDHRTAQTATTARMVAR